MDQVTNAKTQIRLEQWRKIIADCQDSGMAVYKWCKQNGIKEQSYYYYLKKLRKQELKSIPVSLPQPAEAPTVFKSLEIQSPIPDHKPAVIIRLSNATVEINEGTSPQTVQAVLLALQSVC